ncbi:unnamed protein product, partial [Candidula unifasciata]
MCHSQGHTDGQYGTSQVLSLFCKYWSSRRPNRDGQWHRYDCPSLQDYTRNNIRFVTLTSVVKFGLSHSHLWSSSVCHIYIYRPVRFVTLASV